MKVKTLYHYSERERNKGGSCITILVNEKGRVSNSLGGWVNRRKRKKSDYKVKYLHLYHETENGNAVAVSIYVTNEGKVGTSNFLVTTKENNYKRSRKTHKKHPEINEKHKAKRRNLGYRCLNKRFLNSHGHHIDKENVMFIPEELHKSIYHNIWSGQGMQEINAKTFEWIAGQENLPCLGIRKKKKCLKHY